MPDNGQLGHLSVREADRSLFTWISLNPGSLHPRLPRSDTPLDKDLSPFLCPVSFTLSVFFFFYFLKHALVALALALTHPRSEEEDWAPQRVAANQELMPPPSVKLVQRSMLIRPLAAWPAPGPGEADRAVGGDRWGHYLPCCWLQSRRAIAVTGAVFGLSPVLTAGAEAAAGTSAAGFIKAGNFNLCTPLCLSSFFARLSYSCFRSCLLLDVSISPFCSPRPAGRRHAASHTPKELLQGVGI